MLGSLPRGVWRVPLDTAYEEHMGGPALYAKAVYEAVRQFEIATEAFAACRPFSLAVPYAGWKAALVVLQRRRLRWSGAWYLTGCCLRHSSRAYGVPAPHLTVYIAARRLSAVQVVQHAAGARGGVRRAERLQPQCSLAHWHQNPPADYHVAQVKACLRAQPAGTGPCAGWLWFVAHVCWL